MAITPVLFMSFSRPDYARKTFDAIKQAKPQILYFYSNKARTDRPDEIARNEEIRNYISEIDWDCDLKTWFRDEYVDVYTSLLGAKQWAFSNEERLIMLEEDCLASPAFFQFCDHFLEMYKDDKTINYITGNNYAIDYKKEGVDHYITRSIHHHGWATWKDRWEKIDFDILPIDVIQSGAVRRFYKCSYSAYLFYKRYFYNETGFIQRTQCWDYIKVLNQIRDNGYTVTPIYNLVQNVGVKGVHENGSYHFQFEVSNNEKLGDYPFNKACANRPSYDEKYDIVETKNENHRIPIIRYFLSEIYHFLIRK